MPQVNKKPCCFYYHLHGKYAEQVSAKYGFTPQLDGNDKNLNMKQ